MDIRQRLVLIHSFFGPFPFSFRLRLVVLLLVRRILLGWLHPVEEGVVGGLGWLGDGGKGGSVADGVSVCRRWRVQVNRERESGRRGEPEREGERQK